MSCHQVNLAATSANAALNDVVALPLQVAGGQCLALCAERALHLSGASPTFTDPHAATCCQKETG